MANDVKHCFHVQTNIHHCFVFTQTTAVIQLHSMALLSPHHLHITSHHGMLCSMTPCCTLVMVLVPVLAVVASAVVVDVVLAWQQWVCFVTGGAAVELLVLVHLSFVQELLL